MKTKLNKIVSGQLLAPYWYTVKGVSLNGLSETWGHALLIKRETKAYLSEGLITKISLEMWRFRTAIMFSFLEHMLLS